MPGCLEWSSRPVPRAGWVSTLSAKTPRHGTVDHPGRIQPVVTQGRDEGRGVPLAEAPVVDEALCLLGPSSGLGRIRLRRRFVDETRANKGVAQSKCQGSSSVRLQCHERRPALYESKISRSPGSLQFDAKALLLPPCRVVPGPRRTAPTARKRYASVLRVILALSGSRVIGQWIRSKLGLPPQPLRWGPCLSGACRPIRTIGHGSLQHQTAPASCDA